MRALHRREIQDADYPAIPVADVHLSMRDVLEPAAKDWGPQIGPRFHAATTQCCSLPSTFLWRYPSNFLMTRTELCPPKPNALLTVTRIGASRAWFGT